MKRIIFTLSLIFTVSLTSFGQANNEYAVLTYVPYSNYLMLSTNGVDYKQNKIPKDVGKGDQNVNPAITEILKMEKEGWELFNTNFSIDAGVTWYIYTLRRKKS